jgi:hypothetical protein
VTWMDGYNKLVGVNFAIGKEQKSVTLMGVLIALPPRASY